MRAAYVDVRGVFMRRKPYSDISLLSLVFSFVSYFHYFNGGSYNFILSLVVLCFYLFRWFSDILVESTFEGHHTFKVQQGIRLGMCLFILSEMMFVRQTNDYFKNENVIYNKTEIL